MNEMWNQLPSSLKEFSSIKYFSNKLKKFLQTADIAVSYTHLTLPTNREV